MKQKIRTASILLLIVLGTGLVLMACGTKSLADSSTGGSDPYGLNVESMTGKDSCQMELQESEVLALPAAGSCCSNPSRSQSQRVTYVYTKEKQQR